MDLFIEFKLSKFQSILTTSKVLFTILFEATDTAIVKFKMFHRLIVTLVGYSATILTLQSVSYHFTIYAEMFVFK